MPKLDDYRLSEEQLESIFRTIREELPKSLKKPEFRLLKNELWKIFKNVKDPDTFETIIMVILDARDALSNVRILTNLCSRSQSKVEQSMLQVSAFLLEFEGGYASLLDGVCILLIAGGHDLFDPISRTYATTLTEIGDVDISTKFKFLEKHGFKMLVRTEDKKLRNRIAHHDFRLNDKGILIDGKLIDMNSKIKDQNNFLLDLDAAILLVADRRYRNA